VITIINTIFDSMSIFLLKIVRITNDRQDSTILDINKLSVSNQIAGKK